MIRLKGIHLERQDMSREDEYRMSHDVGMRMDCSVSMSPLHRPFQPAIYMSVPVFVSVSRLRCSEREWDKHSSGSKSGCLCKQAVLL